MTAIKGLFKHAEKQSPQLRLSKYQHPLLFNSAIVNGGRKHVRDICIFVNKATPI